MCACMRVRNKKVISNSQLGLPVGCSDSNGSRLVIPKDPEVGEGDHFGFPEVSREMT